MHEFTPEVENLADEILAYSLERLKSDPPLDGPRTEADLFREVGNTITARGLGGSEALMLVQVLCTVDHGKKVLALSLLKTKHCNGSLI